MSQHLINDFINRRLVFKPSSGDKIVNKKLVRYQASNRNNNNSPEDIEESIHYLKPIKATKQKSQDEEQQSEHIDVTV